MDKKEPAGTAIPCGLKERGYQGADSPPLGADGQADCVDATPQPSTPRSNDKAALLTAAELFVAHARNDVHAERKTDGSYRPLRQPVDSTRLRHHLGSGPHIGCYLMAPGTDVTRIAGLDLDNHDGTGNWDAMREIAERLRSNAEKLGLSPWSVRSGGGHGIHLFFRWDKDQGAAAVRDYLHMVLAAAGLEEGTGGIVKGEVEIFPKQCEVAVGGLGNLIAVPFGRNSVPLNADFHPTPVPMTWVSSAPVPSLQPVQINEPVVNADPNAVRDALRSLDADDYVEWIKVGLALKHSLADAGFDAFDEWSRKSSKYPGKSATWKLWDTFRPRHDGVTVGTVFHLARRAGWQGQVLKANATGFRRSDGKIVASDQGNIRLALSRLGVTLSHDVFKDRMLVSGIPDIGPLLDDRAMDDLWLLVDETFGFRPTKDLFWTVVQAAARKNKFHPVREYLDGLQWDGVSRVDTWLIGSGGATDTPYTRAVGALMLVAAVRRIRQPGCKFDEMLVLESGQGKDKSSALKVLAVEESWFTDDVPLNADTKSVIERLRGAWIAECAELQGMRRSELEHVKALFSRQVDRARLSYDRTVTEVPRQCVFFGTTNSTKYLRDLTGSRRFWPVAVQTFDIPALTRDRDQLWAEAAAREAAGESIRLDPALYGDAATEQRKRSVDDPFRDQLEHVLRDLKGKILNADVWDIVAVSPGQRAQEHNARIGEAMRACGWERADARIEGKVSKVYVRGTEDERKSRVCVRRDDKGNIKKDEQGRMEVYLEGQLRLDDEPPF